MIKNIIFSGGGLKGWAYIGTIQALYELVDFKNIEQIIGVSIGSVFGLFYLLNISYEVNYFLESFCFLGYLFILSSYYVYSSCETSSKSLMSFISDELLL